MRFGAAAEIVALHDAREALALRGADHVDDLALDEHAGVDARPELQLLDAVGWNLAHRLQAVAVRQTGAFELTLVRSVRPRLGTEAELHRGIAVGLVGAQLRNEARSRLDQGRGGDAAVFVEEPGHAQL